MKILIFILEDDSYQWKKKRLGIEKQLPISAQLDFFAKESQQVEGCSAWSLLGAAVELEGDYTNMRAGMSSRTWNLSHQCNSLKIFIWDSLRRGSLQDSEKKRSIPSPCLSLEQVEEWNRKKIEASVSP
jgi:hypothetical protein